MIRSRAAAGRRPVRSSVVRLAVSSVALTGVLGLAACSSADPLPTHGAPLAPTGTATLFDLASAQRLVIVTDGGVALHSGPAGRVSVDSNASGAAVVTDWHGGGPQAELDLSCPATPAPDAGPCPAVADVSVPAGAAVTVQARNASVSATGLSGPLNLETVNGDVTVVAPDGAGNPVQLTTRNGSVRASGLRAPTLTAHTVNGDVDLSWAGAPDQVTADTTNGSLDVALPANAPAYAVSAHTQNGEPRLGVANDPTSTHRLSLTTVNGAIVARTAS